jgi:hypothetical protein
VKPAFLLALLMALFPAAAAGAGAAKTVCTITVNSADEKAALRARLPAGRYDFVELVQKGRADWLRSACTRGVQCDVLVVSGHFNAGDTFYSDRIDNPDHLAIDELERAACGDSCPGLFARLKEVYLFGCESLNPDASKYASSYGESGRSRMRRIFAGVPSIYGFSGAAPVGPTAAMLLNRYFDKGGAGAFASGAANSRLLSVFSRNSMTRVGGAGPEQAAHRARICRFFDERTTPAAKLEFAHSLLREADIGEYLKRVEALLAAVAPEQRQHSEFSQALARLSADEATRERFLASTRASAPAVRARMIALATNVGWLSPSERVDESIALAARVLEARAPGFAEVGLVCALNADGALDAAAARLPPARGGVGAGHAAVRACLGDPEAHARTVQALVSADPGEAGIARTYLRHRPIRNPEELRPVARAVAGMPGSVAKVRALDALARLRISDGQVLEELTRSYATASSAKVQNAIAEIFLRSDYRAPDLAEVIQKHRLAPATRGGSVIDSLISRLERD